MNGSFRTVFEEMMDRRDRRVAATVLGSMPKKQRKMWSGWIGQDHFWRGRRVVLPGGQVAEVYGVVRGQVIARWHDPHSLDPHKAAVFDAHDVKVFKLPAAILLGRCKRGIRERPSAVKAKTSRLNGYAPPRPGRLRGRPRK